MLDENDLRTGLRALTATPPTAPGDRAARAARKHVTIRRRRAGFAVATAFAVAVPVVALAQRPPSGPPVVDIASSVRTWPDRRNAGYDDVLERAYFSVEGKPPGDSVKWLYADDVPGTGLVAVAWAECGTVTCTEVSLAWAERAKLPRTAWAAVSEEVDAQTPERPFGWYFRAAEGEGSVLFALGPSYATRLTYDGPAAGTVQGDGGVFVGRLGWVTRTPVVRMYDGRDRLLIEGVLGVPGPVDSVAFAEPVAPVTDVPKGYVLGTTVQGQVGVYTGEGTIEAPRESVFRVFIRCRGSAPADVLIGAEDSVTVPCDGQVHPGLPDMAGRPGYVVIPTADDPYTTYSIAFAMRP